MAKIAGDNPIYDKFIEFLKENNYKGISDPLNTKHSDMFEAWKAALKLEPFEKRSKKSPLRKSNKK